jgi:hypothetical protein
MGIQQGKSAETAELSVESMQAALTTAAALAAAGAVNSSPQTQMRAASAAPQHQRMVMQHAPPGGTAAFAVQPTMTTATSSSHKSLYAAYNAVTQQPVAPQQQPVAPQPVPPQPSRVPIMFPANAHVIPQSAPVSSTNIFDSMKLRRGKWTSEEEAYAELLIKEFEQGTVEGCENGCTLRSFLSKKLHCAPMRISKKYAGTFLNVWLVVFYACLEASSHHFVHREINWKACLSIAI